MENKMFCFQCEQTGCGGCTGIAGVCGKKASTAKLQDELTGALIGLARSVEGNEHLINSNTFKLIIEGLFTTLTNVNFDDDAIQNQIELVHTEKSRLIPNCGGCGSPCGKNNDYDMRELWNGDENIRSLKSLILFGLRGMATYAYHAMVLGYSDMKIKYREIFLQVFVQSCLKNMKRNRIRLQMKWLRLKNSFLRRNMTRKMLTGSLRVSENTRMRKF